MVEYNSARDEFTYRYSYADQIQQVYEVNESNLQVRLGLQEYTGCS